MGMGGNEVATKWQRGGGNGLLYITVQIAVESTLREVAIQYDGHCCPPRTRTCFQKVTIFSDQVSSWGNIGTIVLCRNLERSLRNTPE